MVDAVEYYLQVKASVPAGTTISLTGHSLGGALASLVGVFFGVPATTFDQVPAYATALAGPAFRPRAKGVSFAFNFPKPCHVAHALN